MRILCQQQSYCILPTAQPSTAPTVSPSAVPTTSKPTASPSANPTAAPYTPPSWHLSQNFGQLEYTGNFGSYLSLVHTEYGLALATAATIYNGVSTTNGYACYLRSFTWIASGNYGCSMYKYYPSLNVGYCYVGMLDVNCNAATYSNTNAASDYVFTSRYVYF